MQLRALADVRGVWYGMVQDSRVEPGTLFGVASASATVIVLYGQMTPYECGYRLCNVRQGLVELHFEGGCREPSVQRGGYSTYYNSTVLSFCVVRKQQS